MLFVNSSNAFSSTAPYQRHCFIFSANVHYFYSHPDDRFVLKLTSLPKLYLGHWFWFFQMWMEYSMQVFFFYKNIHYWYTHIVVTPVSKLMECFLSITTYLPVLSPAFYIINIHCLQKQRSDTSLFAFAIDNLLEMIWPSLNREWCPVIHRR